MFYARAAVLPVTLMALAAAGAESPLRPVWDKNKRLVAIEATGWTADELKAIASESANGDDALRSRLGIYVLNDNGVPQLPPLSGSYAVEGGAVRFTPQYPLRAGMTYQASFNAPAGTNHTFKITVQAAPAPPPARVTAIYPSASTLPENQLRFYIHFSAPIAAGEAYQHVKLLKANGQEVKRAFLELGEELWDGSGQRLTLLFDPGRVKKGLKPREEFGPVLEPGETYRLVIDKSWKDANNQPLAAYFEKRFTAGSAVEAAVDWKEWKIDAPAAGSRDALTIHFPRPLDHALLARMIGVESAPGKTLDGEILIADEERRWQFMPAQPWPAGQLTLVVEKTLEDSAGNNLARPFEVDVFDRVDDKPGPDYLRIPFKAR